MRSQAAVSVKDTRSTHSKASCGHMRPCSTYIRRPRMCFALYRLLYFFPLTWSFSEGYYCQVSSGCQCAPGYEQYNDYYSADFCWACNLGEYKSGTGNHYCSSCPENTYTTASGSTFCYSCPGGTTVPQGLGRGGCLCPVGYGGPKNGPCSQCPAGKYRTSVYEFDGNYNSICTSCSAGKFSQTWGATTAYTCQNCPVNTNSVAGSSSCFTLECATGYTGPVESCTACVAGKYKNITGSVACTDCGAGKYSATGASNCTDCVAGKYLTSTGATAASSCVNCDAGKYLTTSGAILSSSCVNCYAGKYSTTSGASTVATCINCVANTYSTAFGALSNTTCLACPDNNSQSVIGSTALASCVCNLGFTGPNGGVCSACAVGKYKMVLGNVTCTDCDSGKYSTSIASSSCQDCPLDSASPVGSSLSTACVCKAGTYKGLSNFNITVGIQKAYPISSISNPGCTVCYDQPYSHVTTSSNIDYCRTSAGSSGWILMGSKTSTASTSFELAAFIKGSNFNTSSSLTVPYISNGVYWYYHTTKSVGFTSETTINLSPYDQNSGSASTISICGTVGACSATALGVYSGYSISSIVDGNTGSLYHSATSTDLQWVTIDLKKTFYVTTVTMYPYSIGNYFGNFYLRVGDYQDHTQNPVCTTHSGQLTASPQSFNCNMNGRYVTIQYYAVDWLLIYEIMVYGYERKCDNQLSWNLDNNGGWRSGCTTELNTNAVWRKMMYSCSNSFEMCMYCPAGKYSTTLGANTSATCLTCDAGKYSGASPSSTCTNCGVGKYSTAIGVSASSTCLDCGAGKYSNATGASALSFCVNCDAGKYLTTTGATAAISCVDCGAGKYSTAIGASVSSTCLNCGAGKYSNAMGASTLSTCVNCSADKYSTTTGASASSACQACHSNRTSPVGSSLLTACVCRAGMYESGNTGAFPVGIQQNYPISSISNLGCVACYDQPHSHWTTSSNIDACKTAAGSSGWILMGSRSSTADTSFSPLAAIKGSDFVQSTSTNVAYLSNGAYWYYYGGKSVGFASTSTISLNSADTESTDCGSRLSWHIDQSAGGYRSGCTTGLNDNSGWRKIIYSCSQVSSGSQSCVVCPAGKYLTTTGATLESSCVNCDVGKYSNALGASVLSTCVNCGAGKYSGASPSSTCTDCGAGKYSTAIGVSASSTCLNCGAGKYSNATGASVLSTCVNCNAGKYLTTTGATAESSCVNCGAGRYSTTLNATTSATCINCVANTYSTSLGAPAASTCLICPSSSQSPAGSTTMTSCICNIGFTGPNGGVCALCAAGKYKTVTGTVACTNCGAGKYSTTLGAITSATCTNCNGNKYSTTVGAGSISACLSCPSSSESPVGSTAVTACICAIGHTGPHGGPCLACAQATYKTTTGSVACTACPSNSISPSGSTALTRCICNVGSTGPDGGTCTTCATGKYKITTGSVACTDCGAGKYGSGVTSNSICSTVGACSATALNVHSSYTVSALIDGGFGLGYHSATSTDFQWVTIDLKKTFYVTTITMYPYTIGSYFGNFYLRVGDNQAYTQNPVCITHNGQLIANPQSFNCNMNGRYVTIQYYAVDWLLINEILVYGYETGTLGVFEDISCKNCSAGKYSTTIGAALESACLACPANSHSVIGSKNLTSCICNVGYTGLDGGTCSACVAGKYKNVTGSVACTNCGAGKYRTSTGATAESFCVNCGAGKYSITLGAATSATCINCVANTYSTSIGALSASTCLVCPNNSQSPAGSTALSTCICNVGFTGQDGGPCIFCVAGKYKTATGSVACTNCGAGKYSTTLNATTAATCINCGANTYSTSIGAPVASACLACPNNSQSSAGSTALTSCICMIGFTGPSGGVCTACAAGKYKTVTGTVACTNCDAGKYLTTTGATAAISCVNCDAGKYLSTTGAASAISCVNCSIGTYSTTTGATIASTCLVCPINTQSLESSSALTSCVCNPGFTGPHGGTCSACASGKYKIVKGNDTCINCDAGKYLTFTGSIDPSFCVNCGRGKYSTTLGASTSSMCINCVANTYSATVGAVMASMCVACPNNSQSPAGSTALTSCICSIGFTGPSGGECAFCAAGKYKTVTGSVACTNCIAGTYSTTMGATTSTTCINCVANTYSSTIGASVASFCIACPNNTQSSAGSTALTSCICMIGFTGPSGGVCTACAAGKYKTVTGSAACTNCERGKYLATTGATASSSCLNCGAGKYSLVSSSNSSRWCFNCDAGKYSRTTGATAYSTCVSNPVNTQSLPDFSDFVCNMGYTGLNGGTCSACAAGMYKNVTGSVACNNCGAGTYLATTGATRESSCVKCATGKYSTTTGATVLSTCLNCPSFTWSPEGSTASSSCGCNVGYTGPNGGTCAACAVGKYKTVTGSVACTNCDAGKYLATTGATTASTCLNCVAGKSSPSGSDASADCINCGAGTYSLAGSVCIQCLEGTYSGTLAATSNSTCLSCAAGKSSPSGSTLVSNCSNCAINTYSIAGSKCTTCFAGTSSQSGSDDSTDCTACPVNTYSLAGSSCTSCPANSISGSGSSVLTNCTCLSTHNGPPGGPCLANSCEAGQYMSDTCQICPANSNSPVSSTGVSSCVCNPGFTGPNGGLCLACTAGKYKMANGSVSCTDCDAGKYSTTTGASSSSNCMNCDVGKYSTTVGASLASTCLSCRSNTVSREGSTALTDCKCAPGAIGNDGGFCFYPCTSSCAYVSLDTFAFSNNNSFTRLSVASETLCMEFCTSHKMCVSYVYDFDTQFCDLGGCLPNTPKLCSTLSNSISETMLYAVQPNSRRLVNYIGSTTMVKVSICPAGTQSSGWPYTNCTFCSPGKFKSSAGTSQIPCSDCPSDTYSGTGYSQCCSSASSCATNQYMNGTCNSCPQNSNSPSCSTSVNSCQCNAGYTGPDGGECIACVAGKYKTVTGSIECTDCGPGKYLTSTGATEESSCVKCMSGTFSSTFGATDNSTCLMCPGGTESDTGSTNITNCSCGFGFTGPSGGPCTACLQGTYKIVYGVVNCTVCGAGKYSETEGAFTKFECIDCGENTYSTTLGAISSSNCISCPSGTFSVSGSTAVSDCICNAGFTGPNGGPCVVCAAGKYKMVRGSIACTDCGAGKYLTTTGAVEVRSCVDCDAGKYSTTIGASVASACVNCGLNSYSETLGAPSAATCLSCPNNSQAPVGSSNVISCVCNTGYTGSNGGPCVACDVDTYKSVIGLDECTSCAINSGHQLLAQVSVVACLCDAGFTGPNGGTCTACLSGTYKAVSGSVPCTNCEAGKYSVTVGAFTASGCINCSVNTYSTAVGAVSFSTCTSCPSNLASSVGSSSSLACACDAGFTGANGGPCTACVEGKYKIGVGSISCTNCDTGKYLTSTGAIAENFCVACDAGKYSITSGASLLSSCVNCGVNLYSTTLGASSSSSCVNCPINSQSPAGSMLTSNCQCNAGYTGSNEGICVACEAGKYKSIIGSDECITCALDSTHNLLAQTSASPCACKIGFTGPNGGVCEACVQGKYKTVIGSSACTNCDAGKFSESVGSFTSSDCIDCYYNTYSTTLGAISSSACIGCPSNSVSLNGSKTLVSCICDAGFTGPNGGPCEACTTGKYKMVTGSIACTDCGAGKYLTTTGAVEVSSCVDCVAGKYSTTLGASSVFVCINCEVNLYSMTIGASSINSCLSCPVNSQAPSGSSDVKSCLCNAGYTGSDGGPCVACGVATYKTKIGDDKCTSCSMNSSHNLLAQIKADSCICDIGFTGPDGGVCQACGVAAYKSEPGSGECLPCLPNSGHNLTAQVNATACLCNIGFTGSNGEMCTACGVAQYKSVPGSTACLTCPPNSKHSLTTQVDITACLCDIGFTGDNGGPCEACAVATYKSVPGSEACLTCPLNSGRVMMAQSTVTDCKCDAGYRGLDGQECSACPAGSYKDTVGSLACTLCGVNSYSETIAAESMASCLACPVNSTSVAGSNSIELCWCVPGFSQTPEHDTCIECSPGFYDDDTTRYECSGCAGGNYSEDWGATSVEVCKECEAGTWSDVGSPTCQICPPNSNSPAASALQTDCRCNPGSTGADGETCTLCVTGKYKTFAGSANCSDCPLNSISPSGSILLTDCQCDAGYTGSNGGTCTACEIGTYKDSIGSVACTGCDAGKYSATPTAAGLCVDCSAGKYLTTTGASVESACVDCGAGKYSITSGATSASSCMDCGAGKYSTTVGASSENRCIACGANSYSAVIGATGGDTCTNCPSGSLSPPGSSFVVDCVCDAGFTGADGESCVACAAGKYKAVAGSISCTDCGAGKYLSSTGAVTVDACVDCVANSYSSFVGATGVDTCISCPSASVSPDGSISLFACTCDKGFTGEDNEHCVACVPGKYKMVTGTVACTDCAAGKYLTSGGATLHSSCTDCGAGTYSTTSGASAADTCITCVANTYSATLGAVADTTCLACPDNTQSVSGSTAVAGCVCNMGFTGPNGGQCNACVVGKYKTVTGTVACIDCGIGKYSATVGAALESTCVDCDADTYSETVGAATSGACQSCPINSQSTTGSDAATDCLCNAGTCVYV